LTRSMKIIAAAINERGKVWKGHRHHEIIRAIVIARGPAEGAVYGEQGFLADDGRFVGREEAAKIAFEAGQIPEPKGWLFSEDVFGCDCH
jgi:hypothetical protein